MRIELTSIEAFAGVLYLRALRQINRWSTFDVARASKVSVGRLNYLERGLVTPTDAEKERLAVVFGVRATRLFQTIAADPPERTRHGATPALADVKP